jgi:hypothetical protein
MLPAFTNKLRSEIAPACHHGIDFGRALDLSAFRVSDGKVYDDHTIGVFQSIVRREEKGLRFIFVRRTRERKFELLNSFAKHGTPVLLSVDKVPGSDHTCGHPASVDPCQPLWSCVRLG